MRPPATCGRARAPQPATCVRAYCPRHAAGSPLPPAAATQEHSRQSGKAGGERVDSSPRQPMAPAAVAHEDWQDMIWGPQPLIRTWLLSPSAPSFGTLSVSHQTSINISNTSASLTTKSSITHE